jgi:hypothetical protein
MQQDADAFRMLSSPYVPIPLAFAHVGFLGSSGVDRFRFCHPALRSLTACCQREKEPNDHHPWVMGDG